MCVTSSSDSFQIWKYAPVICTSVNTQCIPANQNGDIDSWNPSLTSKMVRSWAQTGKNAFICNWTNDSFFLFFSPQVNMPCKPPWRSLFPHWRPADMWDSRGSGPTTQKYHHFPASLTWRAVSASSTIRPTQIDWTGQDTTRHDTIDRRQTDRYTETDRQTDRQTDRHTDTQTDTKVNTDYTISGFQELFLQPVTKDRSNNAPHNHTIRNHLPTLYNVDYILVHNLPFLVLPALLIVEAGGEVTSQIWVKTQLNSP